MEDIVLWLGPGWYAPVQVRNEVLWKLVQDYDREGYCTCDGYKSDEPCSHPRVWDATRPLGLGTPRWMDKEDD